MYAFGAASIDVGSFPCSNHIASESVHAFARSTAQHAPWFAVGAPGGDASGWTRKKSQPVVVRFSAAEVHGADSQRAGPPSCGYGRHACPFGHCLITRPSHATTDCKSAEHGQHG